MAEAKKKKTPAKRKPGRPPKKSNAGRPLKITENVLRKLESAFSMGCTDVEACIFADIGQQTLYDYCKKKPEFSERKEALKKNPVLKARQELIDHIESEDRQISIKACMYVIDKNDGKAVSTHELTGKDGGPIETANTVTVYIPDNGRD